jgi:hypothetical protein
LSALTRVSENEGGNLVRGLEEALVTGATRGHVKREAARSETGVANSLTENPH